MSDILKKALGRLRDEGPSRAVDALIACGLSPDFIKRPENDGTADFLCGDQFWRRRPVSKYTSSEDAARTLVPDNRYSRTESARDGNHHWAWVELTDTEASGYANNLPQALADAALQAQIKKVSL